MLLREGYCSNETPERHTFFSRARKDHSFPVYEKTREKSFALVSTSFARR